MANFTFPNLSSKNDFIIGNTITFNYTGDVQTTKTLDYDFGNIKTECYGAKNMDANGGYVYGILDFKKAKTITKYKYCIIGQYKTFQRKIGWQKVSFGGGGTCDGDGWDAEGASDVRTYYNKDSKKSVISERPLSVDKEILDPQSLSSRLIVAGNGWFGYNSNNAGGGTQTYGW